MPPFRFLVLGSDAFDVFGVGGVVIWRKWVVRILMFFHFM